MKKTFFLLFCMICICSCNNNRKTLHKPLSHQENYSEIRVQNFINELSEEEKECLNRIDGNNSKKLFAYMEEQSSDTSSFYPKEAQEFGRFAIGAFCEDFHETNSFEELLEVLDYEKKHFKRDN